MSTHESLRFLNNRKFFSLCGSLLLVLLPSAVYAAGPNCNLATIAGSYAVATMGPEVGGFGATIFLMTADGNGNLTGAGSESVNGEISSGVTASGKYSVTADCWVTLTTTDSLGNVRNIAASIYQNGAAIAGMSADAGTDLLFQAYRQKITQCTQANGGGYFLSDIQSPLAPTGSSLETQLWFINQTGSGTGSWVANDGGTVVNETATSTVAVNSDCTYTTTENNSDGTTSHTFGVGGINLDNMWSVFMVTDKGWAGIGINYHK